MLGVVEEVLGEWRKCWGSGGSAGGVEEVQGGVGGAWGQDKVLGEWGKCWGSGRGAGGDKRCFGGGARFFRSGRSTGGVKEVQREWMRCMGTERGAGGVDEVLGE